MGFFDRLFGSAGTCGKNLTWELDGDTITISGTGEMELYGFVGEIPWYDKRKSIRRIVIEDGVKTISYYAFVGCENLTSVTIGNSVTTIDSHAFTDCKRLTNVTIPDGVKKIDFGAFERCENLKSITIPDSVTTIDSYIFSDCKNLKEIHYPAGRGFEEHLSEGNNAKLIPYNVTPPAEKPKTQSVNKPKNPNGTCGKNLRWELDGDTLTISGTGDMKSYGPDGDIPWYDKRTSIRRIVIEDGVTTIGDSAFIGCTSLTSVTIPDSVTKIYTGAFFGCENLTSITIPDSVTKIYNSAFADCKNLTSITIPDSVMTIGVCAFQECTSLTSITIPDSVTTIGDYVFHGCTSLTSVTIPDSVTKIVRGAFQECTSLTSVTIPDSVTTIDPGVFRGCISLKEIHYPAGRGFEKNLSMGNNAKLIPYTGSPPAATKPTTQTVNEPPTPQPKKFYPVQSTTKPVAEKLTWSFAGKTLTVGGVREIKFFPYAQIPWLKHLHDIQRIVVGDGVEKISAHAFEECKRLEMLTLPASVKTIGDMFASVAFCGNRFVNGGRNVFWCLEDGVLVLKKNPDAQGDDFSTGDISWIFAEKNIRGIKLEDGVKPTEKFYSWLTQRFDGKEISFR